MAAAAATAAAPTDDQIPDTAETSPVCIVVRLENTRRNAGGLMLHASEHFKP